MGEHSEPAGETEVAATSDAPSGEAGESRWMRFVVPLLALGTVLHTPALFLPWESVTLFDFSAPGQHIATNVPISIVFFPHHSYGYFFFGPALLQRSFAALEATALWEVARPLVGVVLLLAYISFRWKPIRLAVLALYAVWLILLTGIAASFLRALYFLPIVPNDTPSGLDGLLFRIFGTGIVYDGVPPGVGWGYWVFLATLVLSWLAWGWAMWALRRGGDTRTATAPTAPTASDTPKWNREGAQVAPRRRAAGIGAGRADMGQQPPRPPAAASRLLPPTRAGIFGQPPSVFIFGRSLPAPGGRGGIHC